MEPNLDVPRDLPVGPLEEKELPPPPPALMTAPGIATIPAVPERTPEPLPEVPAAAVAEVPKNIPPPPAVIVPPPIFGAHNTELPSQKRQSWGTIISILVIVAMIVFGAFYSWGKRIAQLHPAAAQTTP